MTNVQGKNGSGSSRGFTIIELLISLAVFGVVMTMALSFLRVQNEGFQKGLDRMSALQTLRYAVGILEQDVQTAGTNLAPGQPEMVYAGENLVAFNSDYASRTRADPFAVFFDPDLEDRVATSITPDHGTTIPGTSFTYPDSIYRDGTGFPGPAETLIFFFVPDDDTDRADDFALFRQVNSEAPQIVTRNLLRVGGEPFFRFMRVNDFGLDSIPEVLLPLAHTVPVHGSPADTGRVSLIDSIRAVRVTLAATNGREGELERTVETTRVIRMPNIGFGLLEICGSPPILGTDLSAAVQVTETGESLVALAWGRSTDEAGGENDVVRYVIWRREVGSPGWEEPYLSIPAGEATYLYEDADLVGGRSYEYALAVQDCTPTLSPMTRSSPVAVPIR